MSKTSKAQEARREYQAVKRLYNTMGKKARGKPKTSSVYRDYKEVKREYHRAGERLGRLTGRKSRR